MIIDALNNSNNLNPSSVFNYSRPVNTTNSEANSPLENDEERRTRDWLRRFDTLEINRRELFPERSSSVISKAAFEEGTGFKLDGEEDDYEIKLIDGGYLKGGDLGGVVGQQLSYGVSILDKRTGEYAEIIFKETELVLADNRIKSGFEKKAEDEKIDDPMARADIKPEDAKSAIMRLFAKAMLINGDADSSVAQKIEEGAESKDEADAKESERSRSTDELLERLGFKSINYDAERKFFSPPSSSVTSNGITEESAEKIAAKLGDEYDGKSQAVVNYASDPIRWFEESQFLSKQVSYTITTTAESADKWLNIINEAVNNAKEEAKEKNLAWIEKYKPQNPSDFYVKN